MDRREILQLFAGIGASWHTKLFGSVTPKERRQIRQCIVGIGGGGCNIVDDMIAVNRHLEYVQINSDAQALQHNRAKHKILLGDETHRGLGCGGNMQCGMNLFNVKSYQQLEQILTVYDEVFVVVALGGGVGSGASQEVVQYLANQKKKCTLLAVLPFDFEGERRRKTAQEALSLLKPLVDKVYLFDNNDLLKKKYSHLGIGESFKMISMIAYDVIRPAIYTKF